MEQQSYTKQLLMKLNQQRFRGHLCDVIIVVENALFRAHKNVLAACSGYFKCLVLQDNLITLNTEVVKPSVFKQVLDFIYTGQLPTSHHAGVSDLLRAASYLQLSDLAALCRRKLCQPSTTSSHSHRSGAREGTQTQKPAEEEIHRGDLSPEEAFPAQCVSVKSSAAIEIKGSVETGLRAKFELTTLPDDSPFNSTSAFYNPRSESQQAAALRRPRSSREGGLEGSIRTKGQEVEGGELVQTEQRLPSELRGQREVREEDLVLKNGRQNSEEGGSEYKDGNKHASFIYHHPQLGSPALQDRLYMCIPCRRGFPSSEQLAAHVDSHSAEESRLKAEDAEEGRVTQTEESVREDTKAAATSPRHVCYVCGRSFVDVASLTQHERSHGLIRPFSCHICGKPFTQRGTMMRHMRSHLGLKPFACEECGMRFTRQYRKMEHMRIHSREKLHECPLCGVKVTQQSIIGHLKLHTVVS